MTKLYKLSWFITVIASVVYGNLSPYIGWVGWLIGPVIGLLLHFLWDGENARHRRDGFQSGYMAGRNIAVPAGAESITERELHDVIAIRANRGRTDK